MNAGQYLIGIDNGSQSTKVTIFDERGVPVCAGRQALRPNATPRPGVVEHPDDDLWDSIGAAARQAMAAFPGDPSHIVGVGLCTIRFCRALLRADGRLARPVMSWMDERVSRAHEHTDDSVAWVTTSSGYITHRLTGRFVDTVANYQGLWPIDSDAWGWSPDPAAFQRCGMPREALFELVMPGTVLGEVTRAAARHTGLPEGLPVVATANDKAVEALGCGLRAPGTLLVSLGTYIASMTPGNRNVFDNGGFWTNFSCVPQEYLYESHGIRRGMWTVSWLRDLLGDEVLLAARAQGLTPEELLNAEGAKVRAGCDGLMTVLDWLAPTEAPYRRGMMIGFDGRQGRYHLYRSILEGIALTLRRHAQAMVGELDSGIDHIVVSGGGSNSGLITQILADVFRLPVVRPVLADAAGLGSAICAAVGLGVHGSWDEAVRAMVRTEQPRDPDPGASEQYQRIIPIYDSITSHTDPLLREAASVE